MALDHYVLLGNSGLRVSRIALGGMTFGKPWLGNWKAGDAGWGMDQADRYVDDIRSACLALADGERAGRRVDVRDGYLKYPVGRHLIFFRQAGSGIVVIRVLRCVRCALRETHKPEQTLLRHRRPLRDGDGDTT